MTQVGGGSHSRSCARPSQEPIQTMSQRHCGCTRWARRICSPHTVSPAVSSVAHAKNASSKHSVVSSIPPSGCRTLSHTCSSASVSSWLPPTAEGPGRAGGGGGCPWCGKTCCCTCCCHCGGACACCSGADCRDESPPCSLPPAEPCCGCAPLCAAATWPQGGA